MKKTILLILFASMISCLWDSWDSTEEQIDQIKKKRDADIEALYAERDAAIKDSEEKRDAAIAAIHAERDAAIAALEDQLIPKEEEDQEQIDTVKPEEQELIETETTIENLITPPLQTETISDPIEIEQAPIETDQEKEDREEEERLEQERLDRLDRLEQEILEQERLDEQRLEQERLEAQRLEREFEEQVSQALLARQERIAVARRGDNRHYYYVIGYDESLNKYSDGERALDRGHWKGRADMTHYFLKYDDELAVIEGEDFTPNSRQLSELNDTFDDELFEIRKEINLRTDFSDRAVIEDTLRRIDEIVIRNRFALKRYVDQYR